jgi:prevent-host-death family protein
VTEVPARELRNNVSAVLRRVEAGERLRVTVSGRPVAELVPLPSRRRTVSWAEFTRLMSDAKADPALAAELAELLPESTDEVSLT